MGVSVPKIGSVQLGDLPRVVLGVDGNAPVVAQATGEGIDILEVRVDLFSKLTPTSVVEEVKALRRHGLPLIGTVRSREEGGNAEITDSQRADLYAKISSLVDAIDIDLSAGTLKSVIATARDNRNTLILSHHDFHSTPSERELEKIVGKATSLGADVVKIATLAEDESDVVRLLQFTLKHQDKNLVTIAMGSKGSISRLLFPLAGSLMTYTSVSPADGQIPAKRLLEDLRLYYPRYNEELINRLGLLEYA